MDNQESQNLDQTPKYLFIDQTINQQLIELGQANETAMTDSQKSSLSRPPKPLAFRETLSAELKSDSRPRSQHTSLNRPKLIQQRQDPPIITPQIQISHIQLTVGTDVDQPDPGARKTLSNSSIQKMVKISATHKEQILSNLLLPKHSPFSSSFSVPKRYATDYLFTTPDLRLSPASEKSSIITRDTTVAGRRGSEQSDGTKARMSVSMDLRRPSSAGQPTPTGPGIHISPSAVFRKKLSRSTSEKHLSRSNGDFAAPSDISASSENLPRRTFRPRTKSMPPVAQNQNRRLSIHPAHVPASKTLAERWKEYQSGKNQINQLFSNPSMLDEFYLRFARQSRRAWFQADVLLTIASILCTVFLMLRGQWNGRPGHALSAAIIGSFATCIIAAHGILTRSEAWNRHIQPLPAIRIQLIFMSIFGVLVCFLDYLHEVPFGLTRQSSHYCRTHRRYL
jgi:hypothetical protein